jgi:hypothetical protein
VLKILIGSFKVGMFYDIFCMISLVLKMRFVFHLSFRHLNMLRRNLDAHITCFYEKSERVAS